MRNNTPSVNSKEVENSIRLLKLYITDSNIEPLLGLLEELKNTPEDISLISKIAEELDQIGVTQGAVLTYAPYVNFIISDIPR